MMRSPLLLLLSLVSSPLLVACGSDVVTDRTGSGGSSSGASDAVTTGAGAPELGVPCDVADSLRCSPDGLSMLRCEGGTYQEIDRCDTGTCQEVQGHDAVACDDTLYGILGTPCIGPGTQVCDFAAETTLGCEDGVWKTFIHCAPVRCVNVERSAELLCSGTACEGCGYSLGDRCSFPEGTVNCSTDVALIVGCTQGLVTLFEDCGARGLSCTFSGGTITCQ